MFEHREVPEIPGVLQSLEVTESLQKTVLQIIGWNKPARFPGSQPVSFERKHIEERLKKHDYYVCEKSDGLRCLMLILSIPLEDNTFEEGVFMITRKNEYYRVFNIHFPRDVNNLEEPQNNTLVDGELVLDKKPDGKEGEYELRYLIFDVLAVNSKSYVTRSANIRVEQARWLIDPYYKYRNKHQAETSQYAFKVSLKKMHTCSKIPQVLSSLPDLLHVSDGLIFTCCETPYIFETDRTLLKWKPAEENSIDFKLKLEFKLYKDEEENEEYYDYDSKPKIELQTWLGNDRYERFGDLTVTDKEWEQLKGLQEPLNFRVAEVHKNKENQWTLLRFRDDKEHGNHSSVVKKILDSIRDGVSSKELINATPDIKECWANRDMLRRSASKRKAQTTTSAAATSLKESTSHKNQNGLLPTWNDEDDDDEDEDDYNIAKRHKA